jgi:DNA-binding CsgD family transcriptional regulator
MGLWQRILRTLGYAPGSRLIFNLDQETLRILHEFADEEDRPPEEMAVELLGQAISRRQVAEANLQRWQRLSPREQQVAVLIRMNYTNRQIAARLMISPETVKSHVRNALNKFGLRSKVQLRQALADWDFGDWEQRLP